MSQKVLFYQEDRPKTADGLWMHKDSNGNMKLDYVGNNSVYPIGYINSEAGGGGTSDGYKAYLKFNPSSELLAAGDEGLIFTSAADAAQSLGISEQDFLKLCSTQMPTLVNTGDACLSLNDYAEGLNSMAGYISEFVFYVGTSGSLQYEFSISVFKESSEADDSTKQYHVILCSENVEDSEGGATPK